MEANVSFRLWVPRHNPDFLKQGKPQRRMVEPGVYDENARKAAVDGILTRGGGYGVGTAARLPDQRRPSLSGRGGPGDRL